MRIVLKCLFIGLLLALLLALGVEVAALRQSRSAHLARPAAPIVVVRKAPVTYPQPKSVRQGTGPGE